MSPKRNLIIFSSNALANSHTNIVFQNLYAQVISLIILPNISPLSHTP